MSNPGGIIQFVDYRVINIEFTRPATYPIQDKEEYKYNIAHGKIERSDKSIQMNIIVRAFDADSESYEEAQTKVSVELAGIFKSTEDQKWDERWDLNAIAILYPYARSLISSITAQTGRNPIIVPTINTFSLLQMEAERQSKTN